MCPFFILNSKTGLISPYISPYHLILIFTLSVEPSTLLLYKSRLFVSKYTYGYSRHSFPFSPKIFDNRLISETPERGDVIIFKTPVDNRTDYIKRLIGLPGDTIQIKDQQLYLNGKEVFKEKKNLNLTITCGREVLDADLFEETLPNGKKYITAYRENGSMQNTDIFLVPDNHFFFMGDNRDCSKDSRFLSSVGYVEFNNLVGKAQSIFFSNDKNQGSLLKVWKWNKILRIDRIFKRIK